MALVLEEQKSASFPEGWQSVTINKAETGDYNGTKYYDLRFEGYPETLKCRVWETKNKEGQEFMISNLIRYTDPEIVEELDSTDGTRGSVNDAPSSLTGKTLQVYMYKNDDGYTEISPKVVPSAPFKNIIDDITDSKIVNLKSATERWVSNRKPKNGAGDNIPF